MGAAGRPRCPSCKDTWRGGANVYPSVDLTPIAALADFETPWPEPIEEYERLCELVRPLLPPGAQLEPGAGFGPLEGKAQGRFGPLFTDFSGLLLVQREALDKLQAEGLRGLKGCPDRPALPPAQLARVARAGAPPRGPPAPRLPPPQSPTRLSPLWPPDAPPPEGPDTGRLHPSRAPRPVPAGGLLQRQHLHRALCRCVPAPGIGWRCLPTRGGGSVTVMTLAALLVLVPS